MELIPESANFMDYLEELDVIDFSHPFIQKKINELFHEGQSEIEKAKIAFEFVRDEISHSWDIQSTRVTCKASEVLFYKEGICYANANLLAALIKVSRNPDRFLLSTAHAIRYT